MPERFFPPLDEIFVTLKATQYHWPRTACWYCTLGIDGDKPFCDACEERVSLEIDASLRLLVADTGHCMRCCRERPTCEGLFCQACYAGVLLDEGDT